MHCCSVSFYQNIVHKPSHFRLHKDFYQAYQDHLYYRSIFKNAEWVGIRDQFSVFITHYVWFFPPDWKTVSINNELFSWVKCPVKNAFACTSSSVSYCCYPTRNNSEGLFLKCFRELILQIYNICLVLCNVTQNLGSVSVLPTFNIIGCKFWKLLSLEQGNYLQTVHRKRWLHYL